MGYRRSCCYIYYSITHDDFVKKIEKFLKSLLTSVSYIL